VATNLDDSHAVHLPYGEDSVDFVFASHLIEHIRYPLVLMEELYRVAKPTCEAVFRCPYGSTDDAWEDPTHVRPMFHGSWGYFGQPHYWNKDYLYTGDWQATRIQLVVRADAVKADTVRRAGLGEEAAMNQIGLLITQARNIVAEMIVTMRVCKPARERHRDLQERPNIVFELPEVEPEAPPKPELWVPEGSSGIVL